MRTGRGGGRPRRLAVAGLLALFGYGCATELPWQHGPRCRFAEATFSSEFPGGRLARCRRAAPGAFILAIEPEARPVNPSPWYAFDVVTESDRSVTITLDYGDFAHRYAPKLHTPSGWRALAAPVRMSAGGSRARFVLRARAGSVRVAAQPLITPADEADWMRRVAATTALQAGTLGRSFEGREIGMLVGGSARAETLVVTGRQHPPEITGALALRAFVERLVADDALAARFRNEYRLFVVPLLNPDGVVRGNWRYDSAGSDLNRDWGPFTRPETRLVRDALTELDPALVLDFHSTTRDVLYTPLDEAPLTRSWFPAAWHEAINRRLDGPPLARAAAHNPDSPTLKSWVAAALGVPGITFEVGDATETHRLQTVAVIAAEEAMNLLLAQRTAAAAGIPLNRPAGSYSESLSRSR